MSDRTWSELNDKPFPPPIISWAPRSNRHLCKTHLIFLTATSASRFLCILSSDLAESLSRQSIQSRSSRRLAGNKSWRLGYRVTVWRSDGVTVCLCDGGWKTNHENNIRNRSMHTLTSRLSWRACAEEAEDHSVHCKFFPIIGTRRGPEKSQVQTCNLRKYSCLILWTPNRLLHWLNFIVMLSDGVSVCKGGIDAKPELESRRNRLDMPKFCSEI